MVNSLALAFKEFVESFPHWLSISMLVVGTFLICLGGVLVVKERITKKV